MKGLNLRAFDNANYRLFFYGQLVSVIGTCMQTMMEAWLVYRLTQSTFWLGIINFCGQGAAFLACPFAGVMIDRHDRRKLLMSIEIVAMIQATLLTVLFFSHLIRTWQIACLAMVLGVANAFEMSTRHAFAADLVGRPDLPSAISMNSVALNIGRVFGPSLAGAFVAVVGEGREGWGFALNALSFVAVIVGLNMIKSKTLFTKARPAGELPADPRARPILSELTTGIRHAWKVPVIRKLLVFITVLSLVAGSHMVLYPSIVEKMLGGGGKTLGLISGATGCGALFGAIGVSKTRSGAREVWRKLVIDVMFLGSSFVVLGLSRSVGVSMVAAFGVGSFLLGAYPLANVTIQQEVDDEIRGRIISLLPMTFLGAAPVGALALGYLADHVGISLTTVFVGIACMALGMVARSAKLDAAV